MFVKQTKPIGSLSNRLVADESAIALIASD